MFQVSLWSISPPPTVNLNHPTPSNLHLSSSPVATVALEFLYNKLTSWLEKRLGNLKQQLHIKHTALILNKYLRGQLMRRIGVCIPTAQNNLHSSQLTHFSFPSTHDVHAHIPSFVPLPSFPLPRGKLHRPCWAGLLNETQLNTHHSTNIAHLLGSWIWYLDACQAQLNDS